ncbi:sensor histidine kinase [Actinoplanes missouriensis]|uniref:sensor histidine kinase n=1 Tax=Actinoplanes missouriensis TaxID=1866 RepID=UPI001E585934|nr:GAF domain-containing protein [Actinoplanes missouriensis]
MYRNRSSLPFPAEIGLSVVAGAASFAIWTALCLVAPRFHLPAVALGVALLGSVLAVARAGGILYALPVGAGAVLAYDWFGLPPFRELDNNAFMVLGLSITTAVIVGAVATAAGQRLVESDQAHIALAQEQAALRRVATLVAGGAQPAAVFTAVADELAGLIGADATFVTRRAEPVTGESESVTVVGSYGGVTADLPVASRIELKPGMLLSQVLHTGEAARMSGAALRNGPLGALVEKLGVRATIAIPVMVGPRRWGVVVAGTAKEDFPAGTEARIRDFIELAALAIANAQAEQELRVLAETQEALRRLALLIAQGVAPEVVFAAVTKEVLRHFGNGTARLIRYELDGTATLLANEGTTGPHVQVGQAWQGYPATGLTAAVQRSGQTARVDDYRNLPGGDKYAAEGLISAVGMPIHVNGRLWGMIAVGSGEGRLPDDTEARMAVFTELVATAVADAQSHAELISSRARIVAAADEARRRIERDLHDGAQQRLVALALRLRSAAMDAQQRGDDHREMNEVAADLLGVIDELRELSRGIHPAVLSDSGLRSALRALGRRSPLPVGIEVRVDGRLPQPVEVGAYYVVSEMLTNAVKHAGASAVQVDAEVTDGSLTLRVCDDGVGSADPARGTGLLGLKDRIEALGGTFDLHSPAGEGTTVICRIPLTSSDDSR